jgi:hypothetical protein
MMRSRIGRWVPTMLLLQYSIMVGAAVLPGKQPEVSTVKSDQEIIFFPGTIHQTKDGKDWELEVHGCVYEADKRRLALALLREALHLDHVQLSAAENTTFAERARLFMVDHERGRTVVARLGDFNFAFGKSRPDGKFSGVFRLPAGAATNLRSSVLKVQAVMPANDNRQFSGPVTLLESHGLTVISDIDDTIKVTRVLDRRATLRNTFLEPFAAVPGMPELYQAWAEKDRAQFCYVSASPWQLFAPLSDFTHACHFPAGTFYLKDFRWKDRTFFNLFEKPDKYKLSILKPILERFVERRFVLVGDSGEMDPEIYGELARQFPRQIEKIFIREVRGDTPGSARYAKAFHGLDPDLWKIFIKPSEIQHELPVKIDNKTSLLNGRAGRYSKQ